MVSKMELLVLRELQAPLVLQAPMEPAEEALIIVAQMELVGIVALQERVALQEHQIYLEQTE
jgi:hypothetical protein